MPRGCAGPGVIIIFMICGVMPGGSAPCACASAAHGTTTAASKSAMETRSDGAAVPALGIVLAGRRYTLRADQGMGADGDPRTIIFLEPPQRARLEEFLRLGLSPREAEIAAAIVRGDRTDEIATGTGLSPNTVKTHVRSIFDKLDVTSRRDLARRFVHA